MKKLFLLFLVVVFLFPAVCWGQSYLGLDGGLEGSATVDNTNLQTGPQAGKWTKSNSNQTIADETSNIRSGAHSLRINNSSTTGRKMWSPLISVTSQTTGVTIQYYRRVADITNSQNSALGVSRSGTESLQGTYGTPLSPDTWEKLTYSPNSSTFSDIAAIFQNRQIGTGGNMYIDDICIYAGSVDNTSPNPPTSPSVLKTSTNGELSVSWTAASGGVDNGGYLVLRKVSSASTGVPNVNGIYAVGNTIGDGTVAYVGTSTNFTDTGLLTDGTSYYYTVFTFDKAYNYSSGVSSSGNQPLPVELTFFTGVPTEKGVVLNWATATEVNNYGFELERCKVQGGSNEAWEKIAFIQGHGNSNSPKNYSFTDAVAQAANVSYRLKQIDFDGKFEYSSVVNLNVAAPASFAVKQNFPNPFNPSTVISYQLPASSAVTLKVFDMLGKEISTLVNENQSAGNHNINFDGSNLSSGMYFYKVQAGNFIQIKKMLLLK